MLAYLVLVINIEVVLILNSLLPKVHYTSSNVN